MSLYPRKLSPGDWLLLHYRIRSFEDEPPLVRIDSTIRGEGGVAIDLPTVRPSVPPRGRANIYCAIRIDRRFTAGRYQMDSQAMIGPQLHLSKTRATDYFDVFGSAVAADPRVCVLDSSERVRVIAAFLAAMQREDLGPIVDATPDQLADTPGSAIGDALAIERWALGHEIDRARVRGALAKRIIGAAAITQVERAAYRLLDIPHLLKAVDQRVAEVRA